MSLLPRRGPGRHSQPGGVAVHPGWTLSPTSVTETPAYQPEHVRDTAAQQPQSRWTSAPPVPAVPSIPEPESRPEPETEPVAVVAPALEQPAPAAAATGWVSEWEAVAATPASPGAPLALHTDAVAALDAVFGVSSALAAWTAAPADLVQAPHPAPRPMPALTELDLPLSFAQHETATPLAVEAARVAIPAAPAPIPAPAVAPPPPPTVVPQPPIVAQPVALAPLRPAPPVSRPPAPSLPPPAPAPRGSALPSAARHVLEQAIRTAPSAPTQRRSTVRLGFADASVIDLRPDDPIAKALHTVADALIDRGWA